MQHTEFVKIRSLKGTKAFVCRICRFPLCKYRISYHQRDVTKGRAGKKGAESRAANRNELASSYHQYTHGFGESHRLGSKASSAPY